MKAHCRERTARGFFWSAGVLFSVTALPKVIAILRGRHLVMRPDPVFCFVSAHFDRRLYVAAVAFNGLVTVGWVDSPGGWTPWQIMGLHPSAPQPCFDTAFYADGDTLPLLIQYGTVLYLFVRRRNNKLRVIRKSGVGNWDADWLPLRTDGQVGGRIALALRKLIAGAGTELHMIYAIGFNSLEYRQYVPAGLNFTPLPTWHQWCHVIESVLVPDGAPPVVRGVAHTDRNADRVCAHEPHRARAVRAGHPVARGR